MIPIVCFTSDFGLEDSWVGVCHATIYRSCPQAFVVDMAHQIPPFDIRKGAVVAASGAWQLPKAVHLVAVDPGVGGGRRDVCVVAGNGTRLVGPDNGVLLLATWRAGGVARAVDVDPRILRPRPPLPTFHARDVLAPAVAALSSGVEPEELGEAVDPDTLTAAPFRRASLEGEAAVAEVLDVDRFGSVRIGVSYQEMEEWELVGDRVLVAAGHVEVDVPFGETFSDVGEGEPVALVDSSGWFTLSVREGSAAERFGLESGASARVSRGGS